MLSYDNIIKFYVQLSLKSRIGFNLGFLKKFGYYILA